MGRGGVKRDMLSIARKNLLGNMQPPPGLARLISEAQQSDRMSQQQVNNVQPKAKPKAYRNCKDAGMCAISD